MHKADCVMIENAWLMRSAVIQQMAGKPALMVRPGYRVRLGVSTGNQAPLVPRTL